MSHLFICLTVDRIAPGDTVGYMFEEIRQVTGKQDGPISIILAGVHGDEKCGVKALQKIMPSLEIECGTVYWGYGNLPAIEKEVRFTEVNLNRMFIELIVKEADKTSYEYKRAQHLKPYLEKADVLLDLHASSIPDGRAFAICESNAADIVKYLPVDLVVSGFDDVEPGATDGYMNSIGKIGICLECGYLSNEKSDDIAEKSLLAFLKARGHISGEISRQEQSHICMYTIGYSGTDNFRLTRPFDNFEKIEAGQLIGMDGQQEIRASKPSYILFAHNADKIGDEIFLLGE
jgi:succinylglutamate desuccinylase